MNGAMWAWWAVGVAVAIAGCAPSSGAGVAASAPARESGIAPDGTAARGDAPSPWRAIVDASDRSSEDRKLDAGRHPLELLTFLAPRPGMRVADLGAGPGYTTELLARAVGPQGTTYMQNEPSWLPFLERNLAERFTHEVMKGVIRADRPFGDPLPPEASGLDLVVMNLIYHDIVNTETDRALMNRRIFAALKPGGAYVVIDSSAAPGTGLSMTEKLHRIDEQAIKDEVPKAGFVLGGEGDFLRNAADARDWSSQPGPASAAGKRGTSDRFVLRFVKPPA